MRQKPPWVWPEPWNEPPTRGIVDIQQIPPICRCAQCGGEIYPGSEAYTDYPNAPGCPGSVNIHKDCLMDWVRDRGDDLVAEQFGFEKLGGDANGDPALF